MGASSIGIVQGLAIPWTISAIMLHADNKEAVMSLSGYGTKFTIMSLALVSLTLFVILTLSRYTLRKVTGVALGLAYLSFITFAVMAEMGYVYPCIRQEVD